MERYSAYRDVMQEADVAPREPWLIGEPGKEPGVRSVLQSAANNRAPEIQTIKGYMSSQLPRPTATFAANDYIAIFALRAMKTMHLQIPDDISLAGFDGTDLASQLEVPLTTVAQDPFTIGQRAAQILIDRIEGDGLRAEGVREPQPRLVAPKVGLVVVDGHEAISKLCQKERSHLQGAGSREWSGGVYPKPLPDGTFLCIVNPFHSERRNKITLMEEIVHIFRRHKPTQVLCNGNGVSVRDYNQAAERECFAICHPSTYILQLSNTSAVSSFPFALEVGSSGLRAVSDRMQPMAYR